jgi:SLT domain-containing protein
MEARQKEVVVPNSDQFDKLDQRAARGMVLLNTAAPDHKEESIEVISQIPKKNTPQKNDGWPKFRGSRK